MRPTLLTKVLPVFLFALGFCFTVQTPAMACNMGSIGYLLYGGLIGLPVLAVLVISGLVWLIKKMPD